MVGVRKRLTRRHFLMAQGGDPCFIGRLARVYAVRFDASVNPKPDLDSGHLVSVHRDFFESIRAALLLLMQRVPRSLERHALETDTEFAARHKEWQEGLAWFKSTWIDPPEESDIRKLLTPYSEHLIRCHFDDHESTLLVHYYDNDLKTDYTVIVSGFNVQ